MFFDNLHDPWQPVDTPPSGWLFPSQLVSSPVQAPLQQTQSILTNPLSGIQWKAIKVCLKMGMPSEIMMMNNWIWGHPILKQTHIYKYIYVYTSSLVPNQKQIQLLYVIIHPHELEQWWIFASGSPSEPSCHGDIMAELRLVHHAACMSPEPLPSNPCSLPHIIYVLVCTMLVHIW